jgi:hypothetical protein
VPAAPTAIFPQLDAVRIVLLVLRGGVVAALAVAALEGDYRVHRLFFRFGSKK